LDREANPLHDATAFVRLSSRRNIAAIIGLGVSQLIGWGTTFSPLTILATPIGQDLDLSREAVFTGITIMLVVSAVLAPRIGRLVDRTGARPLMVAGSLAGAIGMLMMSQVSGFFGYVVAWAVVGCAVPFMLTNTALPGLVQVVGSDARRAITALTLITGLTSTVFMPLTAWLLDTVGWRGAFIAFAAGHLVICLPMHTVVLRRGPPEAGIATTVGGTLRDGLMPHHRRAIAFLLIALWSCSEGLITWGLYVQVIDVFKALGLSGAAAVGIWALIGPAQASARFGELLFGRGYSIAATGLMSALLSAASFVIILSFAVSPASAMAFTICIGLGHGLFAVARNTLPLVLFGAREYGTYMGWLTAPQNLVNAVAPIVIATVISRVDALSALWVACAAAVSGLLAVSVLSWLCWASSAPTKATSGARY
jgi:predicted MFS family arabinose efflux permease